MPPPLPAPPSSSLLRALITGFAAGLLGGLLMLIATAGLRLLYGVPTLTELVFNHVYPHLTAHLLAAGSSKGGGDGPFKLDLAAIVLGVQLLMAGGSGSLYAGWLHRRSESGGTLILAGVFVATALGSALLWPDLSASYRGLPPERATFIGIFGMLLAFAAGGLGIMGAYRFLARTLPLAPLSIATGETSPGRRAFLAGAAGAGMALVLSSLLHRLYRLGTFSYDGKQYAGPEVSRITPIEPEDRFYEGTRNLVDPDPARSLWRLEIGGQVDTPRSYTFAEIAALPPVTQETTLLSQNYTVGGEECSNASWTGVPLMTLLDQVKPWGDDAIILFQAADGFYETAPFGKALEPSTLLAYAMNGQPLPSRHGYPLRLIVPGLFAEKSAKWVTRLEVLDRNDPRLHRPRGLGYYQEQGWELEGSVPTHSRIDAPKVADGRFAAPFLAGKPVEIRGMAFGGDRGISKVEISVDSGQSWRGAEIHQPGTKISWIFWRFLWTPVVSSNALEIVVRATDGEGRPQTMESRPPYPRGATGLHRVRAQVVNAVA